MSTPVEDLVSPRQRLVRRVAAVVGVAALAVGAFVVYELATEDRGAAPCKHLVALGDPRATELVVRYTESRVVRMNVVDSAPLTIDSGNAAARCKQAFDTLEHVMDDRHFVHIVDCTMKATTAAQVRDCLP